MNKMVLEEKLIIDILKLKLNDDLMTISVLRAETD